MENLLKSGICTFLKMSYTETMREPEYFFRGQSILDKGGVSAPGESPKPVLKVS